MNSQLDFLKSMKKDYDVIVNSDIFKKYDENNLFFTMCDAVEYAMMISKLSFKNVVEVGCGNSSDVLYDSNLFFNKNISINAIDPSPRKSIVSLSGINYIQKRVEEIDLEFFNLLKCGDLLFIDSSHIYKEGSDCYFILNKLIPSLNSGTYIYFHDIFWPMIYPDHWKKYFWNEIFYVKKMIDKNDIVEVVLHTPKVFQENEDWVRKNMPKLLDPPFQSGGIWLQKK